MINKNLLRKYLNGECSPEEQKQVSLYFTNEGSDMDIMHELLDESWDNTGKTEKSADASQVDRIITSLRTELYPAPVRRIRSRKLLWYAAAAVLIIAVSGLLFLQNNRFGSDKKEIASAWKTLSNTGTRSMFAVLPDSSRIWLSAGSSIQYPEDFNIHERAVRISGEAFFDVAQQQDKPFTVHNGAVTTQVLGTSFNIEAYEKEGTLRVSLVSGKLAVTDSNQTTQLHSGEMLSYHRSTRAFKKEVLKDIDPEAWTKGYIIFNEIPVNIALERIAARYNRTLIIDKELSRSPKRISTIFKNENMDEMLQLLLFVTKYTYKDDGQSITILKNH